MAFRDDERRGYKRRWIVEHAAKLDVMRVSERSAKAIGADVWT